MSAAFATSLLAPAARADERARPSTVANGPANQRASTAVAAPVTAAEQPNSEAVQARRAADQPPVVADGDRAPEPLTRGWYTRLALQVLPVSGSPSSSFGVRRDPMRRKRRKQHNGLDFGAPRRTPVFAAASGVVVEAKRFNGYGKMVVIAHGGGWTTRYAHLQRITVRAGERVSAGDRVGKVGSTGRSTGPHLHFEVRRDGRAINPIGFFPDDIADLIRQALKGTREQRGWARAALLNLMRAGANHI